MPRVLWISLAVVIGGVVILAAIAIFLRTPPPALPWPAGLGTLDEVPQRHAPEPDTPSAGELTRLALPLGIDFRRGAKGSAEVEALRSQLAAYTKEHAERADGRIDAPPEEVARYLAAHADQLAAVRRHLLAGGPLGWKSDVAGDMPIPNLGAHMSLFRLLNAGALTRARDGDAAAWDDLQAMWHLAQGLWRRSDLISQLVALSGTRMMLTTARRLPAPEPAWLDEVRALDARKGFLDGVQAEAWLMRKSVQQELADGPALDRLFVFRAYTSGAMANALEEQRRIAEQIAASDDCVIDHLLGAGRRPGRTSSMGRIFFSDASDQWDRFARLRAEIELTDRVFAARRGETPEARSACADGRWISEKRPDGTIAIRFSRPIPQSAPNQTRYPLEFVVAP